MKAEFPNGLIYFIFILFRACSHIQDYQIAALMCKHQTALSLGPFRGPSFSNCTDRMDFKISCEKYHDRQTEGLVSEKSIPHNLQTLSTPYALHDP